MDRYCIVVSTATELGTQERNFLSGTLHNSVWSHKPAGGRLFVACRDREPSRVKWSEIQDCAAVSVADTVLECCITGDSGQYELADIVHSLCDQLPRFGYFLDLFWIFYGVRDSFSLPLEICSALLRLSEWHRGKVTLLSADERVQLGLPAELQSEFGNLAAVRSSFGDASKQQVCWRGSIIIGSAILEDCSLRCLKDGCEVNSSGFWPGVALSTNSEAMASISAEDSMAASTLVFNSIIDLDDLPIALMCHQTYVLEVPQSAGNVLPSWKALLDHVAKQNSGILLKLDWLQPLPAHMQHGKWSIDDVGARDAGKLCCSQLTTRNWEAYITEEENAQCIAESCCSRSVSHCFLLLTPADWSDGVEGVSTVLATCLRQPDVANGMLPHRRSCCCRCRCVERGLALSFVDPERLLDAFVPPGSPSTWPFDRRPADGARSNAATTTASAAAADAQWDTSSSSMWPERRLLEGRALQGESYRRRSQSPSASTGDRQQLGSGLCLTLNEMARRLSMSLRESSNLAVSDGSSGNASRLPAHVSGCSGSIVPPADAAQPWPTCRMARGPGVHYNRGECSEEEEVRLHKFRASLPPHRETSSSFNAGSTPGFPIFVPQAAKGIAPLQSCPPLKCRKLDEYSKCTTDAEKTVSDRTRCDPPLARTSRHPSSSAVPSPSSSSLACSQTAFARSAPAASMQPSASRRARNEVVEPSGGPVKRSQQVDRMRSQSNASGTVADHGSGDLPSGRPARERECSTTVLASSVRVKSQQKPPGDEPRSKESRSERHKRRLLDIVTNVLKRKGVTPENSAAFAACQQRLFNTVKGFVKDLPNSHSLGDNMRRLAEKFCGEVIEFETSVLMSKRAATHAPD